MDCPPSTDQAEPSRRLSDGRARESEGASGGGESRRDKRGADPNEVSLLYVRCSACLQDYSLSF